MKKILVMMMLSIVSIVPFGTLRADEYDNYQEWEEHDVVGVYVEISRDYAKAYGFDEVFDEGSSSARYFEKVRLEEGAYKIEVYDKVDTRFWGIRFTKYFIKFRYNPYLYNYDEGVLEWYGYSGTFYEKP
jgi:hypothetical protein